MVVKLSARLISQIEDTVHRYERLKEKCRKKSREDGDTILRVCDNDLEALIQTDFIWDWRVTLALGEMLKEIDRGISEIPEDLDTIADERRFLLKGAIRTANHLR